MMRRHEPDCMDQVRSQCGLVQPPPSKSNLSVENPTVHCFETDLGLPVCLHKHGCTPLATDFGTTGQLAFQLLLTR